MSSTDTDPTDVELLDKKTEAPAAVLPEDRLTELREKRARLAGTDDYDAALEVL